MVARAEDFRHQGLQAGIDADLLAVKGLQLIETRIHLDHQRRQALEQVVVGVLLHTISSRSLIVAPGVVGASARPASGPTPGPARPDGSSRPHWPDGQRRPHGDSSP